MDPDEPVLPEEPVLSENSASGDSDDEDVEENKPRTPKMGGIVRLTKDEWAAWTGGKPKYKWKGLDDAANTEHTSPNQLRPTYASSAQKGYNYRRDGMTTKFKKGDQLTTFVTKVWNHLVDTGMDTIAYLPDPENSKVMTNVVKCHSRFTIDSARSFKDDASDWFDKYDKTNDKAARHFVLESLDEDLKDKVEDKLEDDDTFTVTWLTFIKAIQSVSIERFKSLK